MRAQNALEIGSQIGSPVRPTQARGAYYRLAFWPCFRKPFSLRPSAMSRSFHRQSLRPSPSSIPKGLIFSAASQRCTVISETPISLAAWGVL